MYRGVSAGGSGFIRPVRHFCLSASARKQVARNVKGTSSQQWVNRQINDPYVIKAKRENYRARSAFKLLEIQERTGLISAGDTVLDCGCAPGAWIQVALAMSNADARARDARGAVIGVDRLNLTPLPPAQLVRGDFTRSSVQRRIISLLPDTAIDVVLSDMAPNASGIKHLDHQCISDLCYAVTRFSLVHLRVGGSLLMKLWSGDREMQLKRDLSRFFRSVRVIKPDACRSDSTEFYLLATQFVGAKR